MGNSGAQGGRRDGGRQRARLTIGLVVLLGVAAVLLVWLILYRAAS
jgi:hypothetical protein